MASAQVIHNEAGQAIAKATVAESRQRSAAGCRCSQGGAKGLARVAERPPDCNSPLSRLELHCLLDQWLVHHLWVRPVEVLNRSTYRFGSIEQQRLRGCQRPNVIGDVAEGLCRNFGKLHRTQRLLGSFDQPKDRQPQGMRQRLQQLLLLIRALCPTRPTDLHFRGSKTLLFIQRAIQQWRTIYWIRTIITGFESVDEKRWRRNDPRVSSDDQIDLVAKSFGQKLREAREGQGMTQERLGQMSATDRSQIGRLESGTTVPRLNTAIRLVGALGLDPCALMADVRWSPPSGKDGGYTPLG